MTEEYVDGIRQYHDMKTWMILVGALEILIGAFLFLLGIMSFAIVLLQPAAKSATYSLEMSLAGMLFYIILAASVILLGIGTIMCRKWARAIGTAGWESALVWGIIGMVYFFSILSEYPKIIPQQPGGGPPIQNIVAVVILIMGIIISIFAIGVPALFFFFFLNKHVRMTCENYDRKERWTDAVPLPVLPILLILGGFLFSICIVPFYGFTIPFFGTFVQGWQGAALLFLSVILSLFLIKTLYQLKTFSWYITLVSGIIMAISTLTTFIYADVINLYKKMGYPEEQIELMQKMDIQPGIIISTSLTFICFIIYMFWIRKYFKSKNNEV